MQRELGGEKAMKEQMKDDATLFSWLNVTPSRQTFILCVLEKEGERQREYDDSLYSPISLSLALFPLSLFLSAVSEVMNVCVCLSSY